MTGVLFGLCLLPKIALATNPTIYSPVVSTAYGPSMSLDYQIYSPPTDVRYIFDNGTGTTVTLHLSSSALHPASFSINPANLTASITSGDLISASSTSIPDGTYSVTLAYNDGDPMSITFGQLISTSISSVVINTVTQTPTLLYPTASSAANTMHLSYTLPETPLNNSVQALFTGALGTTYTFTLSNATSGNFTFNPASSNSTLLANFSSYISAISPSATHSLPDDTYSVSVRYQDALGNTAAVSTAATNVVVDTTAPTITLVGSSSVSIDQNSTYTDAGATASDTRNGDLTSTIVTTNPVTTSTAGVYTVRYNVSDAVGNAATEVTRTVTVLTPATSTPVTTDPISDSTTTDSLGVITSATGETAGSVKISYSAGSTTTFQVFSDDPGTPVTALIPSTETVAVVDSMGKNIRIINGLTGTTLLEDTLQTHKQKNVLLAVKKTKLVVASRSGKTLHVQYFTLKAATNTLTKRDTAQAKFGKKTFTLQLKAKSVKVLVKNKTILHYTITKKNHLKLKAA